MKQSELNIYKYLDGNGHSVYTNSPREGMTEVFHQVKSQVQADENCILSSTVDGTTSEFLVLDSAADISAYVELSLDEAVQINPELSTYTESREMRKMHEAEMVEMAAK